MLKDRAAVVGLAQTRLARSLPESEAPLAASVVLAALKDAGIVPHEVDGLVSSTMESTSEVELARCLGLGGGSVLRPGRVWGRRWVCDRRPRCHGRSHWSVPSGGGLALPKARLGRASLGEFRTTLSPAGAQLGGADWYRPWGLLRPVDQIAMLARRYMHDFGATSDHFANIALAARAHANRNPQAVMYDRTLTSGEYHNACFVSEPLCLFDNCLETDGAAALVIVGADRAIDAMNRP